MSANASQYQCFNDLVMDSQPSAFLVHGKLIWTNLIFLHDLREKEDSEVTKYFLNFIIQVSHSTLFLLLLVHLPQ